MKNSIFKPLVCAILITFNLSALAEKDDPLQSWFGSYRMVTPDDDRISVEERRKLDASDFDYPLGNLNIFRFNKHPVADFSVTGPPFYTVIGGSSKIQTIQEDRIIFEFKDGWGNQGVGTFIRGDDEIYQLVLEIIKEGEDSSSGRGSVLYGTYDFRKDSNTPDMEANPWSLGRLNPETIRKTWPEFL